MSSRLLKQRRRSTPYVFILSALMLTASFGLFVFNLIQFSRSEDRLPAGLTVGGVRVGGMIPEQAQARWEQAFAEPVILYYESSPIVLNPESIGFELNSASMLAAARSSGEIGGGFWQRFLSYLLGEDDISLNNIDLQAVYQQVALQNFLTDIARRYDSVSGEANFDLQTLTTFNNEGGVELNMTQALEMVDEALRDPVNRTVQLPTISSNLSRPPMDSLRELIIRYLDSQNFIYDSQASVASIYIQDLRTGEELRINSDVAYTAASTIKVGVLIDYFKVLDEAPTDDDAFLMANSLLCSANSTTNLIIRQMIGGGDQWVGIASVMNTLQYIGARNTYINAPFIDGSADQVLGSIEPPKTSPNTTFNTGADIYNQTTAEDMGTIFSMLYDCATYNTGLATAYPNGEITQQECKQMIELMSANDLERLLQGGIPEDVRISHKNGWFGETVGNTGIVYSPNGNDYVISVYLWKDAEDNFQDHLTLWPLVEGISRATWNYFNPEIALLTPRTDLPNTARECYTTNESGNITYNYLPPYGQVNLNDINAWRR